MAWLHQHVTSRGSLTPLTARPPSGQSETCILKRKRDDQVDEDIVTLPLNKRGRPLLLGQDLDTKVQLYRRKVRDGGGGAVSARIVTAAARGILLKCDRTKLVEFGGHVELSRHWAHSLLKCMNFVQRKATTAKSKQSEANFRELKQSSSWRISHPS